MKKALTLSLILIAGLLAGCNRAKEPPPLATAKIEGDKVVLPVESRQATALTIEEVGPPQPSTIHLDGRLVWVEEVTDRIYSPIAGRVRKLMANLGQTVSAGDTLALLDSPDFAQAQADFRKALSDLQLKERVMRRTQELFEHGAAPRKDLDSAEADYNTAVSEQQRALTRMLLYGGNTNSVDQMFPLKAPIGGVIVDKNINPGQEVRSDQMLANAPQLFAPLFTISDPTRLWVWLDVTEMELPLIHPGEELRVRTKVYPDKVFKGTLDTIGHSLNPIDRTLKALGHVDNNSDLLKAEMYVTVEVADASQVNIQVPSKAVFSKNGQHYVFIELHPGEFQRRAIDIGVERAGLIIVRDGIKPGQRVVVEGCLLLDDLIENAAKS